VPGHELNEGISEPVDGSQNLLNTVSPTAVLDTHLDISSFCGCVLSAPPGTLSVSFAKAVLVVFHRDLLN
jgi:hypothetical protein